MSTPTQSSDAAAPSAPTRDAFSEQLRAILRKTWGFDALRPLQREAIEAGINRRDSLVILPTGGGKSLCYQVPPLLSDRVDVVVSPLIALMKDQVDGLRANGYPAVALHSGVDSATQRELEREIHRRKYKLIFVAPERLLSPGFLSLCRVAMVTTFAIDEAHCISQWGHDFRPEYRQLSRLRTHFPDASLNAYTATATPRVREDIVAQLELRSPAILVGTFDRPNLTYRVIQRTNLDHQVAQLVQRHARNAVIVYCISRRDTEELAVALRQRRIRAAHYHAGMSPEQRRETHDAFQAERIDVVVATVAFGMGIDRGDVRCVIHAAMPKSIEQYQQETGRAGRDGLPAECVLLYSSADFSRWETLMSKTADDGEVDPAVRRSQLTLLAEMQEYALSAVCRHRRLSEYFGQPYEPPGCGACDVCLGEIPAEIDASELAQKILSCVARVQQKFGIGHVADVLRGRSTKTIRACEHDRLSTFGLLKSWPEQDLKAAIHQMIDRNLLTRTPGDRPLLKFTDFGLEVMRGNRKFFRPAPRDLETVSVDTERDEWAGVDRALFELLRGLRREIADAARVPPFVIFNDTTLQDMARHRPTSAAGLRRLRGIGERKLASFGDRFVAKIAEHCRATGVSCDVALPPSRAETQAPGTASLTLPPPTLPQKSRAAARLRAIALFDAGVPLDEIARQVARAVSTTCGYLAEYVQQNPEIRLTPWVPPEIESRIDAALQTGETHRLTPLREAVGDDVSYEQIRLVRARWMGRSARSDSAGD